MHIQIMALFPHVLVNCFPSHGDIPGNRLDLIRYSSLLFEKTAFRSTDHFYYIRVILVSACSITLFIFYFLLLRPTSIVLARTSAQANAMMTLLPAQTLWHVKQVQHFIRDNLEID